MAYCFSSVLIVFVFSSTNASSVFDYREFDKDVIPGLMEFILTLDQGALAWSNEELQPNSKQYGDFVTWFKAGYTDWRKQTPYLRPYWLNTFAPHELFLIIRLFSQIFSNLPGDKPKPFLYLGHVKFMHYCFDVLLNRSRLNLVGGTTMCQP